MLNVPPRPPPWPSPGAAFAGAVAVALDANAVRGCECAAIWFVCRVTLSVPPGVPTEYSEPAVDCPCPIGTDPCRFGKAKLVVPLPPNCVPIIENSAVFCAMDSSCPSQDAHPTGAKLNGNGRISARNGFAIRSILFCQCGSWRSAAAPNQLCDG